MSHNMEGLAISTYKKNLLYFEEYQKEVYSKLAAFDAAIESGHYQSKYDLIIKENYFDVLELQTNKYLYSGDSNNYAELASNSLNFHKDSNVYETFRKVAIKEDELEKYTQVDIRDNNLSGFAPILHFIDRNMSEKTDLKHIKKFIFFGVGLGTHLITIDKKIFADVYLIVEDDLELFKLSLFTTPYYELASNAQLIFSVFDSKKEFTAPAIKFLETKFQYNHYIKYFPMLNHNEEKLKEFHLKITSQSHNLFYYNAILKQYLKPLDYLSEKFNFINLLKTYHNSSFSSKPALLLAAGPSLRKNIKWLKINHEKFIIVALSATLSTLEEENISPDIVTHIDGFIYSIAHFNKLKSLNFLKDTIFLISARTPSEIVNRFNKKNIFFFENGTSYKKEFGNLSAPCVGSTSYLLLIAFGFKELYLLGLDLALNNETGSTHSDDHEYNQKLDLKLAQKHEDTMVFQSSVIQTSGNFRENVYITPNFVLSIESISATSKHIKKENQNVYNLNDGAYFKNTISKNISAIDINSFIKIDKSELHISLNAAFKNSSSSNLTKYEISNIKDKLIYAKSLHSQVLTQEKINFTNENTFETSLISLFNNLSKDHTELGYDLSLIYQNYFKFIFTFIFDFFNNKNLKDKPLYANTINKLLATQLLRVIVIYEKQLNNIIEKEER